MTINGGIGNDNFIVFHNLDTLDLNGDAGNDTFLVQAFALAGSQEDHRALTDLSGGAGADHIQYAVDAPVNIDGGDGFDTVIVIGTEFNDDFVITPTGVFGAGLNVNFVNIETLVVDGGAGDDRFFVLGTGPNFTTEIDGGLGSDLVSVEGPTPGQRRDQQHATRAQRDHHAQRREHRAAVAVRGPAGGRRLGERRRQRHAGRRRHRRPTAARR